MKEYLIRILSLSLLTALCEYVLPSGRVRRFAAPVLSLAVLSAVLLPLFSFFQGGAQSEEQFFTAKAAETVARYEEKVAAEYKNRVEAAILEKGAREATVVLDADYSISRIILPADVPISAMLYITTELEVPRSRVEIR